MRKVLKSNGGGVHLYLLVKIAYKNSLLFLALAKSMGINVV